MTAARGAIEQQRVTASGELRKWTLDLDAIRGRIGWTRGAGGERLAGEAAELGEHFPTWTAALGRPGAGDYWETGELLSHEPCGAPWVFDRGVRCGDCGVERAAPAEEPGGAPGAAPAAPPLGAGSGGVAALAGLAPALDPDGDVARRAAEGAPLLAFVGRIPAVVDDRPMLAKSRAHLAALRRAGLADRAALHRSYFLKAEGRTFFAPPVFAFFPSGWPRTDPLVMVEPDYFAVLDIPPSHVYPGTSYRLCNYAQWRDVTLRTVLQQRIVPRVLIDVMLSDLKAMGCLEDALDEAGVDLHSVYNVIGRPAQSGSFADVYGRRRERA